MELTDKHSDKRLRFTLTKWNINSIANVKPLQEYQVLH